MPKGFVYVLSNQSMPGLVKIGCTTKMPTERAAELSGTGVPTPFEVEYYCITDDVVELEGKAHAYLSADRQSSDREFFRVSVQVAVTAIERQAVTIEHRWLRTTQTVPGTARKAVAMQSSVKNPVTEPEPTPATCRGCGATYLFASYCPRCRLSLR